ncbi:hypothetical protein F5X96DRAFT_41760 [Biscogniauxia mediterranea]|nr:hypothetical protein F5X96DRAFT_41760 [Biscogniauxia mediterranea]
MDGYQREYNSPLIIQHPGQINSFRRRRNTMSNNDTTPTTRSHMSSPTALFMLRAANTATQVARPRIPHANACQRHLGVTCLTRPRGALPNSHHLSPSPPVPGTGTLRKLLRTVYISKPLTHSPIPIKIEDCRSNATRTQWAEETWPADSGGREGGEGEGGLKFVVGIGIRKCVCVCVCVCGGGGGGEGDHKIIFLSFSLSPDIVPLTCRW